MKTGWSICPQPHWVHDCEDCKFLACAAYNIDGNQHWIDFYQSHLWKPGDFHSKYIMRYSSEPSDYRTIRDEIALLALLGCLEITERESK